MNLLQNDEQTRLLAGLLAVGLVIPFTIFPPEVFRIQPVPSSTFLKYHSETAFLLPNETLHTGTYKIPVAFKEPKPEAVGYHSERELPIVLLDLEKEKRDQSAQNGSVSQTTLPRTP